MGKRNVAWAVLALGALGACGGSSDVAPGGSGAAIALADIPPKYAAAFCTAYKNCIGADLFNIFMNGGSCAANTEQAILSGDFPLIQGKIDAGKVVYDATRAQACIDAITARTCASLSQRPIAECTAAINGTVDVGGPCDLGAECRAPAFCKSSGTCPGTCTALLMAGQDCRKSDECASGLSCPSDTKRCVAPAFAGQACEYGNPPCDNGLVCMGKDDKAKTPGTCKSAADAFSVGEGATCDFKTSLCLTGLSCALDAIAPAVALKCVKSGIYAAGATCRPAIPEACATGYYCKSALPLLDGTCTALPQAGESCGTDIIGNPCAPDLVCVEGRCVAKAKNGVTCASNEMCYSETCTKAGDAGPGTCEANLPCK